MGRGLSFACRESFHFREQFAIRKIIERAMRVRHALFVAWQFLPRDVGLD
jgi:hypothetical protein